jgi:hypothetical protein
MPGVILDLPVAAGATDCVLVTFSATVAADAAVETEDAWCYVGAAIGGSTMFPRDNFRVMASDIGPFLSQPGSYQWLHQMTPGAPTLEVKLQWRGHSAGTTCYYDAWTLTVQRFD